MNEIEKYKNLPSVQFSDAGKTLTISQKLLLELLTEKLKKNEPITKDDIKEWYLNTVKNKAEIWNNHDHYDYEKRCWIPIRYKPEEYYKKNTWRWETNAMGQFKAVLGACIIKGKLLAIPLIEIE